MKFVIIDGVTYRVDPSRKFAQDHVMSDPKPMQPKTVRFNPDDYEAIKRLADEQDMTVGAWINAACAALASEQGYEWVGGQSWGDPDRWKEKT